MATTGVAVSRTVSRLEVGLTLLPPVLWVSLSLLLLLPSGSFELPGDAACPLAGDSLMLSPLIAAGQIHLGLKLILSFIFKHVAVTFQFSEEFVRK